MECFQKNMDTIKGKFPQIANVPKLPKLRSRKVFNKSSKENVATFENTSSHSLALPRSAAVDRTPIRIGTVSSLVDGAEPYNYQIPDNIGRSPLGGRRTIRFSDSNINDIHGSAGTSGHNENSSKENLRFTERLTKQYKELSEFKLSNIFGKKTIVRKTEIQVNSYMQGFEHQQGVDNEIFNYSDPGVRSRRISENYNDEILALPAGSEPTSSPKPKAAISMPIIPSTIEIYKPSSPIMEEVPLGSSHNSPKITSMSIRSPMPHKVPTIVAEMHSDVELFENNLPSVPNKNLRFTKSMSTSIDSGGSVRSRSGSQKSPGMWELKRPIRVKAKDENSNNSQETIDTSADLKKSLTNVFKKLSSATSIDETDNTKGSGMWKLQRPIRVRASAEDDDEPSEFKKQFNKIRKNTIKIRDLITKDKEEPSTVVSPYSTENIEEYKDDPSKAKSVEDIEKLGYGRKNLKYIEKWKIRRRREIRRNEPFPINRSDGAEDNIQPKSPGMWQLKRPIRIKANLDETENGDKSSNDISTMADLKKTLSSVLKKRNLARTMSTDADETPQHNLEPNFKQSKKWSKRTLKNKSVPSIDSFDSENEPQSETDRRPNFWNKRSLKKVSPVDIEQTIQQSPIEQHQDGAETIRSGMFVKAKKRVDQLKAMTSKMSTESDEQPDKSTLELRQKCQKPLESFEDESDPDIDEDEINPTSIKHPWRPTRLISKAYSSGSEESITTPGFLAHENSLNSIADSNEPTVLIVSGPMPTLLQFPPVPKRLYAPLPPPVSSQQSVPVYVELPLPPQRCPIVTTPLVEIRPTFNFPSPPKTKPPSPPKSKPSTLAPDHLLGANTSTSENVSRVVKSHSMNTMIKSPGLDDLTAIMSEISDGSPPPLPISEPPETSPVGPKKIYPHLPIENDTNGNNDSSNIDVKPEIDSSHQKETIIMRSPKITQSPVLENILLKKVNHPIVLQNSDSSTEEFESITNTIQTKSIITEIPNKPISKPKPRHIRKPSMDSNDSDSWMADNIRTNRTPIVGLNKIDERTTEQSKLNSDKLKKWKSIDIFNADDEAFEDFDESLKNVPIVPIVIENNNKNIIKDDKNNNNNNNMQSSNNHNQNDLKSVGPTLGSVYINTNIDKHQDNTTLSPPEPPPKPSRPIVKQASLRRQFSEEKEAEDLNNINVNKLRSRFEKKKEQHQPKERISFRSDKYEKIQVIAAIENKIEGKQTIPADGPVDNTTQSNNNNNEITNKPLSRIKEGNSRLIKQTSSLDVETDGSDISDVYEPISDFVGINTNHSPMSLMGDVLVTAATLKAIQAKEKYETHKTIEKKKGMAPIKPTSLPPPPTTTTTTTKPSSASSIITANIKNPLIVQTKEQSLVRPEEVKTTDAVVKEQNNHHTIMSNAKTTNNHNNNNNNNNVIEAEGQQKPIVNVASSLPETAKTFIKTDEEQSNKKKISDLKKDEIFYSMDREDEDEEEGEAEESQLYSLAGRVVVKELYTIDI